MGELCGVLLEVQRQESGPFAGGTRLVATVRSRKPAAHRFRAAVVERRCRPGLATVARVRRLNVATGHQRVAVPVIHLSVPLMGNPIAGPWIPQSLPLASMGDVNPDESSVRSADASAATDASPATHPAAATNPAATSDAAAT